MFIAFNEHNPVAVKRQDDLTLARLKEEYGDDYDGQTAWPDGVTVRAVRVQVHPRDDRAVVRR